MNSKALKAKDLGVFGSNSRTKGPYLPIHKHTHTEMNSPYACAVPAHNK